MEERRGHSRELLYFRPFIIDISDEESDSDAYQDVPELTEIPEDTTQAKLRGTLSESDSDEESDSLDSSEAPSEAENEKGDASKDSSHDEKDEDIAKKGSKKGKSEQQSSINKDDEDVIEEGRLFLHNIPYSCKEEELRDFMSQYGEIVDVFIPLNSKRESKGYAFVTFMFPEQAIAAIEVIDSLRD